MRNRSAFTLVELLVAIAIIGVIMAMLLPAINSVRQRARLASARVEVSQLEAALTAFQAKYGTLPPSGLTLSEQAPWDTKSQALIRRVWPQFDFTKARDLNKDGDTTDQFVLYGPQCLMLFLGGTNDGKKMLGLSANPLDPLDASTNRVGPFFEFADARLKFDKDGLATYRCELSSDPIDDPIVYYSAYEGSGYVSADEFNGFKVYTNQKRQTFQLVSPGFDGRLGVGGAPPYSGADADNLTNFSSGTMVTR